MRYAQIVMGPAGSGKSTYCSTLAAHGQVCIKMCASRWLVFGLHFLSVLEEQMISKLFILNICIHYTKPKKDNFYVFFFLISLSFEILEVLLKVQKNEPKRFLTLWTEVGGGAK